MGLCIVHLGILDDADHGYPYQHRGGVRLHRTREPEQPFQASGGYGWMDENKMKTTQSW
jgi:hypothetical protein